MLALLLGTIALLAGKVLYGEEALERIKARVVLPADDKVAKQAMDMLSSMDSVESICDFLYMDEEEGRKRLEEGELSVLLIVPENFIQGVMDGSNRPVRVVLSENAGIEARAFREMADAGSRTLSAAQAAIYGADEWLSVSGRSGEIPQAEADLNRFYLRYALDREIYFREKTVSAVGDLTTGEHFAICFLVMFLILGGIPLSGYFCCGKRTFYQKLKALGIGEGIGAACEILAVAFLYALAVTVLTAAASLAIPPVKETVLRISWSGFGGILLVFLAAAAMISAVYELCGSRMSGMMAIFLGGMVMLFLSGGILPSAFLPESLRQVGGLLPGTCMIQGMERAVYAQWGAADTGRMAAVIFVSWVLAASGRRLHE